VTVVRQQDHDTPVRIARAKRRSVSSDAPSCNIGRASAINGWKSWITLKGASTLRLDFFSGGQPLLGAGRALKKALTEPSRE
jgi:hypothetical protein